jgi:hypothetical protein
MSVCTILAKLGSCHSTVKKKKKKLSLQLPYVKLVFRTHLSLTWDTLKSPKKRKERKIKKRREIIITSCMYMVTPHPWLKLEQMNELMSVCPVPCC